jgi:hypothetical protein
LRHCAEATSQLHHPTSQEDHICVPHAFQANRATAKP